MLKIHAREKGVYIENVVLALFERSLINQHYTKIQFFDLTDQDDFSFDALKPSQSFSTRGGSAVCVIPNK